MCFHDSIFFLLGHNEKKTAIRNSEKYLAYSTKYSQAVTHPSTNLARCCLTSVIWRELVCSTWYGRRHLLDRKKTYWNRKYFKIMYLDYVKRTLMSTYQYPFFKFFPLWWSYSLEINLHIKLLYHIHVHVNITIIS